MGLTNVPVKILKTPVIPTICSFLADFNGLNAFHQFDDFSQLVKKIDTQLLNISQTPKRRSNPQFLFD